MPYQCIISSVLMAIAAILSVRKNKLTLAAGFAGWVTGVVIFAGSQWIGLVLLSVFFVSGTASTSFGKNKKQGLGLSTATETRRTTGQVLANAGVAIILSVLIIFLPGYRHILLPMIAGAFSSATADTISSELGNLYGSNYINIVSFRKDRRGLDGVISAEGTLFGVAGSIIISVLYGCFMGFDKTIFIIIVAGTLGNFADSILGATAERKRIIGNDIVNFLNTAIGALSAYLLLKLCCAA